MSDEQRNALPPGYELDRYRIEAVIGAGGFGVTYRATEVAIDREVAIKEFLPATFAMRSQDGSTVHPISRADQDAFEWGLRSFQKEARTLVKFRHPNIVSVLGYFEGNGTAYMVMDYEKGQSLSAILNRFGKLEQSEIEEILYPLLDGLELVHKAGFLHRDIKPGNIYVREDGSPVLLDFGAARSAMGEKSNSMSVVLTAPYAPIEQYSSHGNLGPWTDLYAMSVTIYVAATGRKPPESTGRGHAILSNRPDPTEPFGTLAGPDFAPHFVAAVEHGMALGEEDRPQSVAAWRNEFRGLAVPEDEAATARPGIGARATVDSDAATLVPGLAVGAAAAGGAGARAAETGVATGRPAARAPATPPPPATPPGTPPAGGAGSGKSKTGKVLAIFGGVLLLLAGVGGGLGYLAYEAQEETRREAEAKRKADEAAERAREEAAAAEAKRKEAEAAERKEAEEAKRREAEEERKRTEEEERLKAEAEKRKADEATLEADDDVRYEKEIAEFEQRYEANRARADELSRQGDAARNRQAFQESMRLYQEAAELGSTNAQNNLGWQFEFGHGVPADPRQAYVWYRRAAERGNMISQSNLAGLYTAGRGVARDFERAMIWAQRAVAQNYGPGFGRVGFLHENGHGVPQNHVEALSWYRRGAATGDGWTTGRVGYFYENGLGVNRDMQQAVNWYRRAARAGDSYSQQRLRALNYDW